MNDQVTEIRQAVASWLKRPVKQTSIADISELPGVIGTTIGETRTENQDRAVIVRSDFGTERFTLAVVCDGMGGMKHGAACADLAISTVIESFAVAVIKDPIATLREAISLANSAVFDEFQGAGGTTIAAVVKTGRTMAAATVGDTRVYRSDITTERIVQLSLDDTIAAELRRIRGANAKSELLDGSSNRLAQFVGIGPEIETRTYSIARERNDSIFLASDGAYALPTNSFELILQKAPTPTQAVWRVLQMSRWCGGPDNASIIHLPVNDLGAEDTRGIPASLRIEVWDSFGKLDVSLPRAFAVIKGNRHVSGRQTSLLSSQTNRKDRPERRKARSPNADRNSISTNPPTSKEGVTKEESGPRELKIEFSVDETEHNLNQSGDVVQPLTNNADCRSNLRIESNDSGPNVTLQPLPVEEDANAVNAEFTTPANITLLPGSRPPNALVPNTTVEERTDLPSDSHSTLMDRDEVHEHIGNVLNKRIKETGKS